MADKPKKLSDTARALLTVAATRGDHLIRPPKLPIVAARQVVRSLLNAGLVEEVPRAQDAGRAGERDGASRGGGGSLPRGAGGDDGRAGVALLGDDAEQPWQTHSGGWASGRAGRRGWRRRWQPTMGLWKFSRLLTPITMKSFALKSRASISPD
jgi:hypothetical protein